MFTEKDLAQFAVKGITPAQAENQLSCFETGFPYLELEGAASVGNGIISPDRSQTAKYISIWEEYRESGHRISKFVPASGAASRMFKDLFAFMESGQDSPSTDFEKRFFKDIENFAFFSDLDASCLRNEGKSVLALIASGAYKRVVENLLTDKGLNYGQLPKGLLKFHKYSDGSRTPLEEHMVEGAMYSADKDSHVHLHFTVSPEHRDLFRNLAEDRKTGLSKRLGVVFDISFSEQKPSTDTIAADSDNKPFRNDDGSILFRPGGHGALIENLNEIQADVVFVKNIDNVVPDRLKGATVEGKKLIAGILVDLQQKAFSWLRMIDSGNYTRAQLLEAGRFLEDVLCCHGKDIAGMDDRKLASYIKSKLDRPFRVCGMVRNVGEPGGGPFWAFNADGTVSLQILESSQIDMSDEKKKAMFTKGTHFNPVDLVCALRGYTGSKFNLPDYVDRSTGFISSKSKNGRELKALELPGLWNGAMSDWNTVFVEVPLDTFNPVKTVNDLLREQHQ